MVFQIDEDKKTISTTLRGKSLLFHPRLNKGTAFSKEEREALKLTGIIPAIIEDMETQIARVYEQIKHYETDKQRSIFLHVLLNSNETLFYAFVKKHLEEVISILYTPTVGRMVENYSLDYRHPRGIYINYDNKDQIDSIIDNQCNKEIDLIIICDGEGVLGIGDQGIGGMGIPVAKLAMYIVSGCCSPYRSLPIIVDVGTNNQKLLEDPLYLGLRQKRIKGKDYEQLIDSIINSLSKRFPNALIHWEDFAKINARRHLEHYKDTMACFNDDIQGTSVVVLAAILTALEKQKTSLDQQRMMIVGAGSAGMGIAKILLAILMARGLSQEQAHEKIWIIDRYGLVVKGLKHLGPLEESFGRKHDYCDKWDDRSLGRSIEAVKPTILIGCSTVGKMFTKEMVSTIYNHCKAPIIMPLSNPSERAEAHPHDLYEWTDYNAYIATGSPFQPVEHAGQTFAVSQCNNLFAFPGIGAGMIAAGAKRLTDGMLIQAAQSMCDYMTQRKTPRHIIMPEVSELSDVSQVVARAVAMQAEVDQVAQYNRSEIEKRLEEKRWEPSYMEYSAS